LTDLLFVAKVRKRKWLDTLCQTTK